MCFSIFQVPGCILVPTRSWFKIFHNYRSASKNSCSFRVLGSRTEGLEVGHSRKWTKRTIKARTEGTKEVSLISKTSNLSEEICDESLTKGTKVNTKKLETSELQSVRFHDIKLKTAELADLASLVTVIVFDIETTGFSRENDRIIEIALLDIAGGENSTFQTLVNPERYVPNPHVHGISSHMVNRPDVPRMKDLIPILLQYVRSRQRPGGSVLWVAHNARSFDAPFLANEFSRCAFEIPNDWGFLDTLPLGREVMKSAGSSPGSKATVQALRKHYGVPLVGSAHRAMSDVLVLSKILQMLTFDLKLPISGLVEKSFSISDISSSKKKKNGD